MSTFAVILSEFALVHATAGHDFFDPGGDPSSKYGVWDNLTRNLKGGRKKSTGARGMTAEQAVRFAVVKTKEQLS